MNMNRSIWQGSEKTPAMPGGSPATGPQSAIKRRRAWDKSRGWEVVSSAGLTLFVIVGIVGTVLAFADGACQPKKR